MPPANPLSRLLADMVLYTSHGNRWHRLAEATAGLRSRDLAYAPLPELACDWGRDDAWPKPRILTVRHNLLHLVGAAEGYAEALAPRTRAAVEAEWDAFNWRGPFNTPKSVLHPADVVLRRLHARARRVTDGDLPTRCGMWPANSPKLFVLLDGGILHTAWHLGQVALLIGMSHAARKRTLSRPSGPPSRLPAYPGRRNWADCRVSTRTELCLKLLEASYRESPWHAFRRMCQGLTPAEMSWRPFPDSPLHYVCFADVIRHVASCKIIYADQAFGGRSLDWGDCAGIVGRRLWRTPGPRGLLTALDRAHAYLTDHVAQATDADLDRRNPMHHGVPHTGWQTVASMAQHDAWHAAQLSVLRDLFSALTA